MGRRLYQLSLLGVSGRDILIRMERTSWISFVFLNTLNKHTVFVFPTELTNGPFQNKKHIVYSLMITIDALWA